MIKRLAVSVLAGISLTACTSLEERQAHMQGQIQMIQVQKDAEANQKAAEANAKAKLYEALAAVAMANPEQSNAVAVALAVQGLGGESENESSPVVPLQPIRNDGLEYARIFAGPALNVVTGVATAYINADVAKTQSDNAAAVQINDALQDSRIVEAVAGVGMAAAQSSGMSVAGDNYTLTDSATISQDQVSTVTTTSTTSSTESSITDSYNTLDNTRNQTFTPNTTVTFEGSQMTLADLVTYLSSINSSYSLTVGDEIVATSNDEADEPAEDVTCVPTFEGYQCTGG